MGNAAGLLACAALLAGGCSGASGGGRVAEASEAGGRAAREVRVVAAAEELLVRKVSVTGTLAAEDQLTLSFKVTGRLDALMVDLGSHVSRGQAIARLAPDDFLLRVRQAAAVLRQARAHLGLPLDGEDDTVVPERTGIVRGAQAVLDEARLARDREETFFQRQIGSRANLDSAIASLKVAESRYQDAVEEVVHRQAVLEQRRTEWELARQALADSSLSASFDGMVSERHVTAGQYLAAGAPVVTVVRMHPLRLRLAVPERDAALIRAGLEVLVTLEGDRRVHAGRVVRVSPAIDEESRTLKVEAEVPNPRAELRPGAFANADILSSTRDRVLVVPASAVVTFAGVDKVLVVREGRAAEKLVTVGRKQADTVEIVEGVSPGEPVIVDPGNLVGGDAVAAARAAPPQPPRPGR